MQLIQTFMPRLAIAMAGLVTMALTACGDSSSERAAGDDRMASGEVRGGTISDEMLPLDTLQSQSPALRTPATVVSDTSEQAEDPELGRAADDAEATSQVAEPGAAAPLLAED